MDVTRPANSTSTSPKRGGLKWLVIFLIIAVLFVGAAAIFGKKFLEKTKIKSDYQAVFLNNGQVYFGKLDLDGGWVKLSDIYYLQLTEDLQPASTQSDANTQPTTTGAGSQQQQIQLVKLGSELHGPEDEMYIAKDKILFWENMKSDSKVMQSIRQYQNR